MPLNFSSDKIVAPLKQFKQQKKVSTMDSDFYFNKVTLQVSFAIRDWLEPEYNKTDNLCLNLNFISLFTNSPCFLVHELSKL